MPEEKDSNFSRRRFLIKSSAAMLAAGIVSQTDNNSNVFAQQDNNQPPQVDTQKPIQLPPFNAETERKTEPPPLPLAPKERVGFAIVGLGRLALEQVLPAFAQCKKAKPVALVSGSPDKMREVAAQYGIAEKNLYNYQTFDQIKNNADMQAVYIILPNGLHREFVVRAAQAGKHVLCEKPMANSAKECEEMIAACQRANVRLMVAYRIQYEPHNRTVREMIRGKDFGKVKLIRRQRAAAGRCVAVALEQKLAGGGALYDIGIYCLNTARFLLGEEPLEVSAYIYTTPNDARFREVEENVLFQLRFPSGALLNAACGYDFHDSKRYRAHLERGWLEMDPAFPYEGLQLRTSRAEDKTERTEQVKLSPKNQFALEIDHFAECVKENKQPFTPGEEGLQDLRIMEAIYEAARTGKTIKLAAEIQNARIPRGEEPKS